MSQPSTSPVYIYETKNETHKKIYLAVYFIKKNLYMIEKRNWNFETTSQIQEKLYVSTKELKELTPKTEYILALTNKEDDYNKFVSYVEKMIWKQLDSDYDEDEDDEDD